MSERQIGSESRSMVKAEAAENSPACHAASGGRLFGLGVFSVLLAGLAFGAWKYYQQHRSIGDGRAASRLRAQRSSGNRAGKRRDHWRHPARDDVGIRGGKHLRARNGLHRGAVCRHRRSGEGRTAAGQDHRRELDDQIAQAEATLSQNKASVQQVQANLDLARVTWARDKPLVDKGWTTPQQGSIDVQGIKALEASLAVARPTWRRKRPS